MYNYANKINLASNQSKTEVVINFIQEAPHYKSVQDEDESNLEMQSVNVADIVVTGEFAKEMARLIMALMEDKGKKE